MYASRIKAGKFLAMDSPVDADMVVGVPESGNPAAQGYAMESGIPYGTAFIKNSYVGRTFIKPKQSMRESSVQVKLNVLKDAVKGKRIVMIDDSIVRGTTCRRIVRMLKDAGAKEVHVRISSLHFYILVILEQISRQKISLLHMARLWMKFVKVLKQIH